MSRIYNMLISMILILVIFSIALPADFMIDSEVEERVPVSFKILNSSDPLVTEKTYRLGVKFSVEPGYHMNMIPLFSISAKAEGIDFMTNVLFDRKLLKNAEKMVDEGKPVYLDTKKEYPFSLFVRKAAKKGKINITWSATVYYCADDGVCFRKVIDKESTLTLK